MAKQDCKLCGGTGWVVADKDGISAADRCTCVAESRATELEARAQIPENYRRTSFDNFLVNQNNPIAERALKTAWFEVNGYASNFPFPSGKNGLLLVGPPGAGKTHLAIAALRMLISRGFEGIFFDYQNLLNRIRSSYSEMLGASDREAYRVALETEVLLLDDLGAHRVTDWVEDTVTAIITYRCNHRKPLIATTNLPDPNLGGATVEKTDLPGGHSYRTTLAERVGERARSRLFEMCRVVNLWAVGDYRVKPSRT
jgi:DNA replication protein DnaC